MERTKNEKMGTPITEIAASVRAELKAAHPGCKFSVTVQKYSGGRSLSVYLTSAPFFAYKTGGTEGAVNQFHIGSTYEEYSGGMTPEAWKVMKSVCTIVAGWNHDESDSMTDYFFTNFYFHCGIGKWNKPFECTMSIESLRTGIAAQLGAVVMEGGA